MKLNKQQHEAFAKFFEVPTRDGLREVLRQNIGETDYLDFKREWPARRQWGQPLTWDKNEDANYFPLAQPTPLTYNQS